MNKTNEALKLAKECGATTYTNRHYPDAAAVTFGPLAWEKFCEQAFAAPVQEPIGYFTVNDYDKWEQIDGTSGKPLYERPAAQKPWVGLTDEELQDLMAIYSGVVLYRAIEDTLRERNT